MKFDTTKYRPARPLLPPDIVYSTKHPARGVYAAEAKQLDAAMCCWMAPSADFFVAKSADAKRLMLHFYVPEMAPFSSSKQHVTVFWPGFPGFQKRYTLGLGFSAIEMPLPPPIRSARGPVELHIASDLSLTPTGTSNIHYAALITAVYFQ